MSFQCAVCSMIIIIIMVTISLCLNYNIIIISQFFTLIHLNVLSLFLFDHSLTLRWPKQAAASRHSSHPSWKKFSQTEFFLRLRRTLTAMNTMRHTGLLMVAFPGQRGGSNATGRGRGDTLSSQGDITSNQRSATMKTNKLYLCIIIQFLFGSLCGFNSVSIL